MPVVTRSPRTPAVRRVTLADVARAAGCSPALVSTVINRANTNAGAGKEMTRRIHEAARRLGYRADFASQSLARRSTRTIGVYVPPAAGSSLAYPYESSIIRGIEQVCQAHSYDLLAINLTGHTSPEHCLHKFAERRIDGLILLHVPADAVWIDPLLDRHPHVASVNYYGPAARLATVNFDDRAATALAVEHLVSLGHRRLAYLGPGEADPGPGAALRCRGFLDAMQAHGLTVPDAWVWDRSHPASPISPDPLDLYSTGPAAVDHLLQWNDLHGSSRPTALVCYGDLIALYAIRRLRERGLNVPADISVIGIDDMELCRHVDPPLSSIRQPLDAMGQRVTQWLFERKASTAEVSDLDHPARDLFPPMLVPRRSTAAPGAAREQQP